MSKMPFKNVQLQILLLVTYSYIVIISSSDATQKKILWMNEKEIDDLSEDELQDKIMKIFEDDIVKNTPDEVCIRIANLSLIDSCFEKPIQAITQETKELLVTCSNFRNLSSLVIFLGDHYDLNELDSLIFVKYLDFLLEVMPVEDYFDFMRVLQISFSYNLKSPPLKMHFFFEFLSRLQNSDSTFTLVDYGYIIKVWNPFSDNVSGFVLYEDQRYSELYTNQSVDDNINGTNTTLSVQITSDYLNYLNDHLTTEEKTNFRVIIIAVVEEMLSLLFLRDFNEFLGIYMPGICIDNNLPLIKIDRSQLNRTIKLNEFDTFGCSLTFCPVYEMMFLDISSPFYEHICPNSTDLSSPIIWPDISDTGIQVYYSENFCYYDIFTMLTFYCHSFKRYVGSTDQIKCLDGLPAPTEELYQTLKCSKYKSIYYFIDQKRQFVPAQSYIDVKIQIAQYIGGEPVTFDWSLEKPLDIIDVGLDILKSDEQQQFHLFDLILRLFSDVSSLYGSTFNEKKRKNFIYRYLDSETSEIGFSLRKTRDNSEEGYDYNIEYLPLNNTNGYSHDDNIEAIVLPKQPKQSALAVIFIIPNSDFARNLSFVCKSRILIIVTQGDYERQYFRIYLKIADPPNNVNTSSNSKGYWFDLETSWASFTMVCVSELKGNLDNRDKTITAHLYSALFKESEPSISNITVADLDFLSQLATFMNPNSTQYYT